jgi:hypothetical protein
MKKTFDIQNRQEILNEMIMTTFEHDNGSVICIENKKILDSIKVKTRFGTPSAFGEAWIGEFHNKILAIKKIVLGRKDLSDSFTKTQLMSGKSAWPEVATYIFCSIFVLARVNPNLPITFRYYLCNQCKFANKRLGKKKKPCLITLNEMGDGDLKMYLNKNKISIWNKDLVTNCIFQMAAALYTFEKYLNMTHNDLHWGNVLVHEVKPGGYWKYTINKMDYYVPNLGFMFVLWDFGMVDIPKKVKGPNAKGPDDYSDLQNICSILLDELQSKKVLKHHVLLENIVDFGDVLTLKDLLKHSFLEYRKPLAKKEIIDSFDMDMSKANIKKLCPDELSYLLK